MKKIYVAILALALSSPLLAADGFSSLEEQMTGKEFMAAGLNKLSQEELDALNAWIRARSLGTLDAPTATTIGATAAASTEGTTTAAAGGDRRGLSSKEDSTPITSRILGEFSGWDGQTVFKLENGMIWVQDDKDTFYVRNVVDPEVTIEPGIFNSWHLSIEGYKSECKVRRIQ